MIKIMTLAASLFLVFLSSFFIDDPQDISILPSVPSGIVPGDSFLVKLTVTKGNINGYANLQQYLPVGFSATPVESKNASFSFQDQLVKFTWLELPNEKSFIITYRIKTSPTCYGLKTLNGEFSFLDGDKTKKVPLTPSVLLMGDDDPFAEVPEEESNENTIVERSSQPSANYYGSYDVKLKIKKGLQKNGVRIYSPIPEGYLAEAIESHGAEFSVNNVFVEFFWKTMPDEKTFDVSYRIFADDGSHHNSPIAYMPDAVDSEALMADEMSPPKAELSNSNYDKQDASQPLAQNTTSTYLNIPVPQHGIYYKVQIAATQKSPDRNNEFFRTRLNINDPVDITMHEGWKKYLVGTFENYSEAKQFRIETQAKVPDAFVVAFHAGERIPLQEAWKIKNRNQ
jgi:hypothetical protein